MTDISVTNPSISNTSTADVTLLTANDNAIISGLTDGTKDIRINAVYFDQSGSSDTGWYRISDTNFGAKIAGTKYIDINPTGGATGAVLVGTNAAAADFDVATMIISNGNSGVSSSTIPTSLALESYSTTLPAKGLFVISKGVGTSSNNYGIHVITRGISATEVQDHLGISSQVDSTHTAADNIAGQFNASGASSSGQNIGVDIVGGVLRLANTAADAAQTADANTIMLNGIDITAGNTALSVRCEGTGVIVGTPTPDAGIVIYVNGTKYALSAQAI